MYCLMEINEWMNEWMNVTNHIYHGYFDQGENPNTPNWSPMPGGKWRRFLNLGSKSVVGTQLWEKEIILLHE